MRSLEIKGKKSDSKIFIGESIKQLQSYMTDKSFALVVDKKVFSLYDEVLPTENVITINSSEESKTLKTVEKIYKKFLDFGLDRKSLVMGVGGGIICDVSGFAASTFMRGIEFGFVPTTLLAQVDASVGGKNGVNFDGYKNLVGTFTQPGFVLCDFEFLKTVPEKELKNGLAEIIKASAIADKHLFSYVEENFGLVLSLQRDALEKVVNDSLVIKANIVNSDETENNERKKLNFGHTVGHALEKTQKISHGEAVSIGMVFASRLSVAKGLLKESDAKRIEALLELVGLPTKIKFDKNSVVDAVFKDKKRTKESISFVLLSEIGNARIVEMQVKELEEALDDLC